MSQNNISERIEEAKENEHFPPLEPHIEKIFIIVKAFPNPSRKYQETVCTVGITESGSLIRLYPIPYRYLSWDQRFTKYQWIEVAIQKKKEDLRIDSYSPDMKTIKLGKLIDTKNDGWELRKKIISPHIRKSIEEMNMLYDSNKISLGIIKPKRLIEFKIEKGDSEWDKPKQIVLNQLRLFDKQPKKLDKIPYKFSYVFECDDPRCKSHSLQILDWEITELYRKMKDKYGESMDTVLEKVRNQWVNVLWGKDRDTYLILGTTYPYKTFVVLGVFWPKKSDLTI